MGEKGTWLGRILLGCFEVRNRFVAVGSEKEGWMRGLGELGNPGRRLRTRTLVFRTPGVSGDPSSIPSSRGDLDPRSHRQDLQVLPGCPGAPRNEASRDTRATRPTVAPGPRSGGRWQRLEFEGEALRQPCPPRKPQGGPCL